MEEYYSVWDNYEKGLRIHIEDGKAFWHDKWLGEMTLKDFLNFMLL